MAVSVLVAATFIGAAFTYVSYEGQRKQAESAEEAARMQAEVAKERERRELRIRREQIDYEAALAAKTAAWEIEISLEKAEYTRTRIQEEADLLQAAQIAGYAASGLDIEKGSPLTILSETARQAMVERQQVLRGHEIFGEVRTKEAEEVKRGGEATYKWFTERLHAETGYEVASRYAEAAQFRSQAKYANYGKYLSTASSLISGGMKVYKEYENSSSD